MSCHSGPDIINNGLVLYYDMNNTGRSWKGAPTTNLSAGTGIGVYNNVGGDVSVSLVTTGLTYNGDMIYKETITPITATGVGYLTNANNPGIGVVTGGGGGLANRYTGHSIFFKPECALYPPNPIFTGYSNIGGWQGGNYYEDMGDGWYRAWVMWYDIVTRSDGKYWAINPAGAVLNVPMVIYWASPFKEDSNISTFVSPYTFLPRDNTKALLDLTGQNTLTTTSLTYASDNTFSFNGSSDYINITNSASLRPASEMTIEMMVKATATNATWKDLYGVNPYSSNGPLVFLESTGLEIRALHYVNGTEYRCNTNVQISTSVYKMVTFTFKAGDAIRSYFNGVADITTSLPAGTLTYGTTTIPYYMGYNGSAYLNGTLPHLKVYNRALSATEVAQNFQTHHRRYGL